MKKLAELGEDYGDYEPVTQTQGDFDDSMDQGRNQDGKDEEDGENGENEESSVDHQKRMEAINRKLEQVEGYEI